MRAKDIMTTGVVTVGPRTPVYDIARILVQRHISAVPVVDERWRLIGIVSEGDLLRRHETGTERPRSWWLDFAGDPATLAADYAKAHGRFAEEVMTRAVVTVNEDATLREIARILEERQIKRVPVVRDGRLVGIVSRANLLQALAAHAEVSPPAKADDAALRGRVAQALEDQPWARTARLNVVVADGVVHLWGMVDGDDERRALRVAAENIPGVRAVEDHLVGRPMTLY